MRRVMRALRWKAAAVCVVFVCGVSVAQEGAPVLPPEMLHMLEMGPKGSLMVRATQGTKEGTSPAGATISVQLFHRGQPIQEVGALLDENGMVMVVDVPVSIGVRPLVRVQFAGVTYQEFGPQMTAEQPNAAIDIKLYDVTEEEPEWRVAMRQAIASPGQQSVVVSETVVVENMGDRTWLGGAVDDRGNRTTVRLSLPRGADRVNLDAGFHGWCCTEFKGGVLGVQMPLMPERVTFRYSYEVPVSGDGALLEFGSVAPTSALSVLVPESAAEVSPVGLEAGGIQATDFGPMRLFSGRTEAGRSAGVSLAGLLAGQRHVIPMAEQAGVGDWKKIGAGVGLAVVVVLVMVAVSLKVRKG